MEVLLEKIIIYSFVAIFILVMVVYYVWQQTSKSNIVEAKIKIAKAAGLYEPVSLHPIIDINSCIQTGQCRLRPGIRRFAPRSSPRQPPRGFAGDACGRRECRRIHWL